MARCWLAKHFFPVILPFVGIGVQATGFYNTLIAKMLTSPIGIWLKLRISEFKSKKGGNFNLADVRKQHEIFNAWVVLQYT